MDVLRATALISGLPTERTRLLDNLGRRSPRTLTRGADQLALGQRVMIGRIVALDEGHSFTVRSSRTSDLLFGGPIVLTYAVEPPADAAARSRIVVHMAITAKSRPARLRPWWMFRT